MFRSSVFSSFISSFACGGLSFSVATFYTLRWLKYTHIFLGISYSSNVMDEDDLEINDVCLC